MSMYMDTTLSLVLAYRCLLRNLRVFADLDGMVAQRINSMSTSTLTKV